MSTAWRREAHCHAVDPEIFFKQGKHQNDKAKEWCFACPVQADCLDFALSNDIEHGVYGGMTAEERYATGLVTKSPKDRFGLDLH